MLTRCCPRVIHRAVIHWAIVLTIAASILLPGLLTPVFAQTRQPLPRATGTPLTSPLPEPDLPAVDVSRFDEALVQDQIDALLDAKVDAWMAEMPDEDKVGQLFVVNFPGNDTGIESDIALLIHAYRIGGVVISPEYGNFTNQKDTDTPRDVADLTNRLQALAYGYLLAPGEALPGRSDLADLAAQLPTLGASMREADRSALNVPLFVATEQTGDNLENTDLRRRFTPLPSQMALGAAWTPELTRQVGEIVGRELSAVGVNVLLGPNLDVLVQPRPDAVGGLGVDMYGGNAFWVSEMGRAYVSGVHGGSGGRILTAARHFPGQGDVDRLPDQEVAIVQTPVDDLQSIALPPFKAVSEGAPGQVGKPEVTDMMMPANVRYSGLQGTGDDLTTPLSLSISLGSFLEAESFSTWRESGLLMTNALGLPALRRVYAGETPEAVARSLAFNAFAAGNDLLYLGEYGQDDSWESEMANLRSTIGFFQEQYRADSNFAASVDQAVSLILRAKLRLYYPEESLRTEALSLLNQAAISATLPLTRPVNEIDALLLSGDSAPAPLLPLAEILTPAESLALFAADNPVRAESMVTIRQVARESITVLHPELSVAGESLSAAPKAGNKILIFTDSRLTQECDDCAAEVAVGPEEMEEIILRLYGQDGTGQILEEDITSLTFSELAEALNAEPVEADSNGSATSIAADGTMATPAPVLPAAPEELLDGEEGDLPEQPDVVAEQIEFAVERNPVDVAIEEADWIVFNMLDVDPENHPASNAVKRFLRERASQNENQTVVVMALQAPYFLDATEVSRLSMYLGVYAGSQPFLENAVRVLFRSYGPVGAPPVAVPGTRFSSLSERLSADPLLPLDLTIFSADEELPADAEENRLPAVTIGEPIRIQVGPIMDRNNHIVPDGTRVDVIITYDDSELAMTMPPSETRDGIAVRDVVPDRGGTLEITATSGPATTSEPFRLQVVDPQAATPPPAASVPSATVVVEEAEPVADGTPQPAEDAAPEPDPNVTETNHANPATLLVALFTVLITLSLLLIVQIRILPRAVLVHNLLWGVVVGLGAYVAYAVGLIPGAELLYRSMGVWGVSLVVFLGMIIPMLWLQLNSVRD